MTVSNASIPMFSGAQPPKNTAAAIPAMINKLRNSAK